MSLPELKNDSASALPPELVDNLPADDILRILEHFGAGIPGWYPYALSHGEGIHPLQWLTSFMMHGGIGHLLGNMLFLWVFGIVVEGKVGPARFLALYFGIGIVQNMIEQLLFLGTPAPVSLGASSVLYGLMILAMFWAPGDNILCLFILVFSVFPFSIPILFFSFFYLFVDFGLALFSGFEMGTPLLHVMGAAVGFVPAVLMLRYQMVRSDEADLLARVREIRGSDPPEKRLSKREQRQAAEDSARQQHEIDEKRAVVLRSLDTHLAAGNIQAATRLLTDFRRRGGRYEWSERQLLSLIMLSRKNRNPDLTIDFILQYLNRFREKAVPLRLSLARTYLLEKGYPKRALTTVLELDLEELTAEQRKIALQIATRARKLMDDGALEPGDE
jgi:membrane associated rhomboid family serine protease